MADEVTPANRGDDLAVHVSIDVYQLLKKLGGGAMGTVYLAEDTSSPARTRVAIKVLYKQHSTSPEFLARFQREAKAASRLKHPNIVSTFAARESAMGVEGGAYYYIMEYCDGEPLEERIKREGFVPWEKAVKMVIQVASGLQYAHGQGFIHRDIKPANIYLCSAGVVKILDMGLSKNILDSKQTFHTIDGSVLGTPYYVPPEQAQGAKDIDGRADIYSLGATFYHMLTGRPPFEGETPANIIIKHITEKVPNPQRLRPEIPDALYFIIQKMMAKDAPGRYRDCAALLAELEPISRGEMPLSPSAQAAQAVFREQRRQAEEDARFLAWFLHYGKYAALALGVLVVFLLGRSAYLALFGPSQRDLRNRETISALRDAGEASLERQDWKGAYEKFGRIVEVAESEGAEDAVIKGEAERAKAERTKLAVMLAAAEEERRMKELEEQERLGAEKKKRSAEEGQKAEAEQKRAEEEVRQAAARKEEETRAADEKRKAEEARLAAARDAEEKARAQAAALEAEKQKKERARLELERRKELNKQRDALRTECRKPVETALEELSRLEKKISADCTYPQFAELFRDDWPRVQRVIDMPELKTLREELKDKEAEALWKSLKATGECLFKCQGSWYEKTKAAKEQDFDRETWDRELYTAIEDAKRALKELKDTE